MSEQVDSGAVDLASSDMLGEGGQRLGRRSMVVGAVAAVAGVAVTLVGAASPAGAANGGSLLIGEDNNASATTYIFASAGVGLSGIASGTEGTGVAGQDQSTSSGGYGVTGSSDNGCGVSGQTSGDDQYAVEAIDSSSNGGYGMYATSVSGTGAYAESQSTAASAAAITGNITSTDPGGFSAGVFGKNSGTGGEGIGVYGTQNGSGWGVCGITPAGIGVYGESSSGTGVFASSDTGTGLHVSGTSQFDGAVTASDAVSAPMMTAGTPAGSHTGLTAQAGASGVALKVSGKIELSRSGRVKIPKGATTSRLVSAAPVTASSFVLATVQGPSGNVGVANVQISGSDFEIHLTAAAPQVLEVAWIVLN